MKTLKKQDQAFLLALGLIAVAFLGVWTPGPVVIRLGSAILLALFLPGWLLLHALAYVATDKLDRLVMAVGASYGLSIVTTLGLLYVTGAVSSAGMMICLGLLALFLAGMARLRSSASTEIQLLTALQAGYFLLPVSVAAFFCFTNLGYADYWGDEMNGLLRALSVISGQSEVLFQHTKGPVEILLPAVFGQLAGPFEPFTLRFSFALANTFGVAAFYLLARQWVGSKTGLVAALLLAISGMDLAFGRMIQYQPVVLLMSGLSLLAATQFYFTGRRSALGLAALFASVGLLAHYDMVLVLPPLGYLVWRRYQKPGASWQKEWSGLLWAGLIFGTIVTVFYLPFFLNSHASDTSSYLGRRIMGDTNWPGNNFDELYIFSVMYNSRYYFAFITLLGAGKVVADLLAVIRRRYPSRQFWYILVAAVLLGLLALAINRPSFAPLLAFILLFLLLVWGSPAGIEGKTIYLWLGVTFVGYVFLVEHPRTHLRVIYPSWLLLAALAVKDLFAALSSRISPRGLALSAAAAGAAGGLVFALFAGYQYLLLVDTGKEYIFTYPRHKSSLYWEDKNFPFGSRRLYGAPHRLGWQMINQLYLSGYLEGDWGSNDQGTNLFWYTLGAARNPCYPRYYFLTQFEQRGGQAGESPPADYVKIGQVWNRDRLQIDVYEFAPLQPVDQIISWPEPSHYDTYSVPADFRSLPYENDAPTITQSLPVPATFLLSPAALQKVAEQYGDHRIAAIRDKVALIGYDLDDRRAVPGGLIVLTLYWQPVEAVNLPYKIFTHLLSHSGPGQEPQLWAQADDFPACGTRSSQQWRPGEIITDRHVIKLPDNTPAGGYNLVVGLYEPQTGLRMDVLDEMSNPQGNSFELTPVWIQADN